MKTLIIPILLLMTFLSASAESSEINPEESSIYCQKVTAIGIEAGNFVVELKSGMKIVSHPLKEYEKCIEIAKFAMINNLKYCVKPNSCRAEK